MTPALADLATYVRDHAERGTCRCGKCCDHPGGDDQPTGHSADLVFFLVAARDGADADSLRRLVAAAAGPGAFGSLDPLDGREHGYIEVGGWIGDQGAALMLMGLGTVLGLWTLMTPEMFGFHGPVALEMAGYGLVTVHAPKPAT